MSPYFQMCLVYYTAAAVIAEVYSQNPLELIMIIVALLS